MGGGFIEGRTEPRAGFNLVDSSQARGTGASLLCFGGVGNKFEGGVPCPLGPLGGWLLLCPPLPSWPRLHFSCSGGLWHTGPLNHAWLAAPVACACPRLCCLPPPPRKFFNPIWGVLCPSALPPPPNSNSRWNRRHVGLPGLSPMSYGEQLH